MSSTNKRIRYIETTPGVLRSRRNYSTAGGVEVCVELDTVAKRYRILNSASGDEMASGAGTRNLAVLKIKAKNVLTSLGVEFSDEIRNHGDQV